MDYIDMMRFLRILAGKVPRPLRAPIKRVLRPIFRLVLSLFPQVRRVLGEEASKSTLSRDELYERWVKEFDTLSNSDREAIRASITRLTLTPLISIVMPVFETPEQVLREAIDSVRAQIYTKWELCIADDASVSPHVRQVLESYARQDSRIRCVFPKTNGHVSVATNSALVVAGGEYLALLDHDGALPEHALYLVVESIQQNPTSEVFYTDEDKLDGSGKRFDPHFKPDWNEELFFGQNYINHLTIYKRSAIERVGGFRIGFAGSQDYDLALRIIGSTNEPIIHIPHVLYHLRIFQGARTMSSTEAASVNEAAQRALKDHFSETKNQIVSIETSSNGYYRVLRADPKFWPTISVIVPTRDHVEVLREAIEGLLHKTDYPDLEIVVADNDSSEAETLAYLEEIERRGVKVLKSPGPFNYSRINNMAVANSTGELVLLLNNDVSIIEPHWLKEMVRYFGEPDIGIVGAKLLYPDGTLQHAGVVIGIGGVASHRSLGCPGDAPGNFGRLALAQDVSCVTGACLLIRRAVFDEVGGLDEINLRISYNDVDLCMKARQAGHRIIWTPFAVLYHHESKSRGADYEGENWVRFQKEYQSMRDKWKNALSADPFHNPNLSLETTNPEFAYPPRLKKPWVS